jgi:hypothetical protein
MTLTEQHVNTILQHILHLQEQPSLSNPILDKREQDRKKQFQKAKPTTTWGPEISGLTRERPKPIANATRGEYIAQVLYASKGTVSDNENNATRAILAIDNKKTFAETQRALQKLSGGKGIGQFIDSFFGTYDNAYVKYLETFSAAKTITKQISAAGTVAAEQFTNRNHWKTEKRLRMMITHLQKIGAWSSTISELQKTYDKIKKIAALENKIWKSSLSKQAQDFWNEYYHEILLVLEIATSLIAFPVGLMISAGIGLVNAGLYANEGEYYQAGVTAVFALMPGIGKLVSKIPAIAKLGVKGMGRLGEKMLQRSGNLSKLERVVAVGLVKNRNFLKGIYSELMLTSARKAETNILAKAGLKSMLPKIIASKPNPELLAKVAKLSAADKMVLMISRGIISVAEFSLIMTAWSKGTDVVIKNIWEPIYKKYFANSEYELQLYKDLSK